MIATVRVLLFSALLLLISVPASADRITAGTLIFVEGGGALRVQLRSDSFTFDGSASRFSGIFTPWMQCLVPECFAGTIVDLFALWSGGDLPGTATVGDRTFTSVGSLSTSSSLFATWTGTLPIPSGFESGVLTAPFDFSGTFFFENLPGDFGRLDLAGAGTATATFRPYSDAFPGALSVQSIRYEFAAIDVAPTPEPASVFLLGTGLAAILAARAHRKQPR